MFSSECSLPYVVPQVGKELEANRQLHISANVHNNDPTLEWHAWHVNGQGHASLTTGEVNTTLLDLHRKS